MMKDIKLFHRNSNITPNSNDENKPSNNSESLLDPDPLRPPFTQIQEPIQNPKPVKRHKPEFSTTPSKNTPFRTPEKQLSSVNRNRFGWVPNTGTGTDNFEEINHNVLPQLPPLNRYGTITPRTYKHKTSSIHSETSSTQSTPTKSVTKPTYPLSGSRLPVSVNRAGCTKGGPVMVVDTAEVAHFELKEDPSFWLDHNVQVVIRIRPLNNNEKSLFGYNRCLKQDSCQNITWIGQPETRFMFDYVACETINQEMLFRVAGLPMVENCMSGYNSCMFAYGQTGSGKTHTMLGEISELNTKPSQDRGMTPRIFEFLFARIRAEEESRRDEKLRYNCKCSFLEIYNEQITDLLDPSSTNLLLREDVQNGVYVENLTEFKVSSVHDILTLIIQGSANRRVAATNMNRESSRSHSVFTCIIESTWEKDSMTNFRFSRLNLVDLAGSERQKTSGAEGERLKEAASINKSLSTLGHVIMVLSDLANGKQRHVPYRDSRLTFLLQDSLGGNSKTMIIANVSPSMCSANETLSTLKFAQRARLIQNNAIVNEDMSGDIQALQHQIRLLKEELAILKRQNNLERSSNNNTTLEIEEFDEIYEKESNASSINEKLNDKRDTNGSLNSIRISNKQWKSLEATLAGALRREKTAETTIKQLEAEIEQLNRLVRQREEDARCTKMMLKFREDKINRMESLVKDKITSESFLSKDNDANMKEMEVLRAKVERNPEVTRFALENIRLLDQLRRYQDFYEEGERDLLLNEISQLRNQVIQLLDGKSETNQQFYSENQEMKNSHSGNSNGDNDSFSYELRKTSKELERCQIDLKTCLEMNEKLTREIFDLQTELTNSKSMQHEKCINEESFVNSKHAEEMLNLQLELDMFKSIFEEEKFANSKANEKFSNLETELNFSKSVIEALESQNTQLINELESAKLGKISNKSEIEEEKFSKFTKKPELIRNSLRNLENEDSPLNKKIKKIQASIDQVRHLMPAPNSDIERETLEREMDVVRKQVEIETAEVILCLQEEINSFEEQLEAKEREKVALEREKVGLEREKVELEREKEERESDWETFANEIENVLCEGNFALNEAHDEVLNLSGAFSQKSRVESQVGNLIRGICERDDLISELNKCLEDARNVKCDLEWKLRSLRGATLAINEDNLRERSEKEREICLLREERESLYDEKLGLFLEKIVLVECFSFESKLKLEERRENEKEICLLREERDSLYHENLGSFLEKDVLVNCFGLLWAQKESEFEIQELKSRFEQEKLVSAHKESEFEIRELESRLSHELVLYSIEKEVLLESLVSMQKESELKIRESKSHLVSAQKELEFEIWELKSRLIDELVLYSIEKEVLLEILVWAQKESEFKIRELKSRLVSAQESEFENRELKSRFENESKTRFECLASQVVKMEGEIGDKDREFEIKRVEMEIKLNEMEKNVVIMNESWLKQREALEIELNDAKALSAQKSFEASNLINKIEETQETIKDADNTVNALINSNKTLKQEIEKYQKSETLILDEQSALFAQVETLKEEIEKYQETETLISNEKGVLLAQIETLKGEIEKYQQNETLILDEKSLLFAQIETLNSSLGAKEKEYELICDLVTDFEKNVREVQKSVSEKFESISCDVDQVKSEFKHCISLSRVFLGDIWQDIIKKDCAISVLNLCQMGILLERITGLNVQNGFLKNGINDSNSIIKNLKENNNKTKNELEMCSLIKGKILNDINKSFNKISKKEDETDNLKIKFKFFEEKIMQLKMQEDMMLEKSNCMYNELTSLVNEIDNNKKYEVENEKKRVFRVFERMQREITLNMIDLNLNLGENEIIKNELYEIKGNNKKLLNENYELRDIICSSDFSIKTLKEEIASKTVQNDFLQKYLHEFLSKREKTLFSMNEHIESVSNKVQNDINEQIDMVYKIESELETMEGLFEKLKLENCSLQSELEKRDVKIENLIKEIETLEIKFEDQNEEIEENNNVIETLEFKNSELKSRFEDLNFKNSELKSLFESLNLENSELKSRIEDLNCIREDIEVELNEKNVIIEKFEGELVKIQNLMHEKNGLIEELKNEINIIKGGLYMANALAEENEAIATEARQISEEKTEYAREKEEEVKLLEKSIEELESTIFALENKVDLVKEEAEKQRTKREILEVELQQVKKQLGTDFDAKRNLEMLQKELSEKEAEINQCKGHINELNMHAEAQAREYKQRFKELEAMAQQVKSTKSIGSTKSTESNGSNGSNGSANVSKNTKGSNSPFKGNRGSGSPFKCIGLGIIQQMNSEKEEDLVALKRQIDELESVASSRQKEIFMLNTRLAAAESMTHDVIRDLLGVKMDMSSYASLLDNRQNINLEESDISHEMTQEKEQEIKKLKKRLKEFIEERQGWIDEINQRQTEIMKSRVALEKLKQKEQLLLTENEMLKCENENYKNRVMQLEDEMHSQHSLHIRINHHAKTKEENSILRKKNEDLFAKLQKTEGVLANVRDELARFRVSNGKDPCFETHDENQLRDQLEESEENRIKLAEKLLNLCTSVLKVAGVTNIEADTNEAETALDIIRDRITSLENEVHDLKLKCKLQREKDRLAELRWESSPVRVKLKEINCNSPNNAFGSPNI